MKNIKRSTKAIRCIAYVLGFISVIMLFVVIPALGGESKLSIWIIAAMIIVSLIIGFILIKAMEYLLNRADQIDYHNAIMSQLEAREMVLIEKEKYNDYRKITFSKNFDIPLD